jgi:hypothetical protein
MFGDEKPTTQVDPDEIRELLKQAEAPAVVARGAGGLRPTTDSEWCGPTKTMDAEQMSELIATTAAPPAATPRSVTTTASGIRAATIALFVLLVVVGAAAIAVR